MEQSAIADRRHLRRKLTFWRVATVLVLIAAALAAALSSWPAGGRQDHVARVKISGIIQDDQELLERLDAIARNNRAKALVVTISSPGGTTFGGESVYKAIRKVAENKPVISDIRTLAASAGYMVATAGDTIIAGESSITGSIGVIFQYPQMKDLLDKIGVSLDEIKSAPLKAEPSPFHPASEEAKTMIRSMVVDSFDWFVDLVAERRKLPRDEVLKLADGSIYTGRQALKAKLVDSLGGPEAIKAYLKSRNVNPDLEIVDYDPPRRASALWLASSLATAFKALGGEFFGVAPLIEKIGDEKLFLDGLVSVWQVGRN
ncbi:signal peptide peptidase SppA [Sinorhizobium sp. BG8]|uniref:signal peptide peptidase SppA n=1 Tax=Sinorhizobium sp. BG8 TaxID=2613773 RepID=UPI00193E1D8D|nr:signal peptide peptidase SppA [Sinorhizobium sp. BG8]QRM54013.1 signal peptide peptidase SppA [Sinorhizobium sp. BG8]